MTRAGLFAALAILLCAAPAAAEEAAPIGLVVALRGEGIVMRGEARTALAEGGTLRLGDVVKTGARTSASVRLADGSLLVLGENTEIRLTRALVDDDGAPIEMGVLLRVGRVLATVTGWSGFERTVEIVTPTTRVRVRRATIEIVVDERGATTVRVIEGAPEIEGDATRIDEGPAPSSSTDAATSTGGGTTSSAVQSHEAEVLVRHALAVPVAGAIETATGALDLDRTVGALTHLVGGIGAALPLDVLAPALPILDADGTRAGVRGSVTFR